MKTIAIEEERQAVIHGIEFRLIREACRVRGHGDIFAFRRHADGEWREEFCGFRSFLDAEEQLSTDERVADMAGFLSTEAPKNRLIEALGCVNWRQSAGLDEDGLPCGESGGQYPFCGRVRWHVSEGWSGWVYANGLAVSPDISDAVRVTRWKEVTAA